MLGLVSTVELVSLFIALEIVSVALYALGGCSGAGPERAGVLKYFVTGAFSSALLLYGIALIYGVTGSTTLARIAAAPQPSPLARLAVGLIVVGLGFKLASVPFHMWAPDVYEGAPTSVTAFMAAAVKVAGFGAFLRIFLVAFQGPALTERWQAVVAVLALVTMVVGNLAALARQPQALAGVFIHRARRLRAYGAGGGSGVAAAAVLFYLVGYAAVSLGAFGLLAAMGATAASPRQLRTWPALPRIAR